MPNRRNRFIEPGDRAEVGDDVVFHGDHGNLVRGIVADRCLSPLANVMRYRVVDAATEMFDPDAGRWIGHDKLFMFHSTDSGTAF
jgi:hypothetical protein